MQERATVIHYSLYIKIHHQQSWDTQSCPPRRGSMHARCAVPSCGEELNSSIMRDNLPPGRGGWDDQTWWCCLQRAPPARISKTTCLSELKQTHSAFVTRNHGTGATQWESMGFDLLPTHGAGPKLRSALVSATL